MKILRSSVINLIVLSACATLLATYSLYNISNIYIYMFLLLYIVLFLLSDNLKFFSAENKITIQWYFFCSFFILVIPVLLYFQLPFVKDIVEMIFVCFFCLMKKEIRSVIFHRFTSVLAFIFLLGIIEYMIAFAFGKVIILGDIQRSGLGVEYTLSYQSLFNILPYYWNSGFRFQSLADEPGRIGTLCAFLLFTIDIKEDRKKWIVFCMAGIISFSFVFYIFLSLYFIFQIWRNKINITYLFVGSIVVYLLFFQIINDFVLSRFERDRLDNRTSELFEKELQQYYNTNAVLYGMGNRSAYKDWDGGNAGIKVRFYQIGIIGMALLVFSYSYLFLKMNKMKNDRYLLLIVIWLSFYQRFGWNFPPNTIILFAYGVAYNPLLKKLKLK